MLVLVCSLAFAQEAQLSPLALPASVLAAIEGRHPGAVVVAAEQEQGEHEAQITVGERKLELKFNAEGEWLEEEETVPVVALPASIRATLAKRWKVWALVEAERAISATATTYEVKLTRGKKGKEVVLSEQGAVLEVEGRDEEEGD